MNSHRIIGTLPVAAGASAEEVGRKRALKIALQSPSGVWIQQAEQYMEEKMSGPFEANAVTDLPIKIAATDSLTVFNGCVRVNGSPFLVESHEGHIQSVEAKFLRMWIKGAPQCIPQTAIAGAWA